MDATTAELTPFTPIAISTREIVRGGSLSLAYPEKIPPTSSVKEEKIGFLNQEQGAGQTVPFHLRQGIWGLELPFIKTEDGQIHTPDDRNSPEMRNAWVLKQVKDRDGVAKLLVFKGREQYGKAGGYTKEDLENGVLVLPWDDSSMKMESLGVTRFDPEATSIEVYRYKHLPEPIPVPVRNEERPVPVEDKRWTEQMRQRMEKLKPWLPQKIVDVIPAFLLTGLIAQGSQSADRGSTVSEVPPQDQGIVEPYKAPPMPEFKPLPVSESKSPEPQPQPEPVSTPEAIPTPAFDHPAIELGASLKGLSEHWLGLIADYREKRGTGQPSLYDQEMAYRADPALKGIKHFGSEAERQRLDEVLERLEQKYPGIKDAYFKAFRTSVVNHPENRGKVLFDPEDPQQDKLSTTIIYTDNPFRVFEKASNELGEAGRMFPGAVDKK